MGNFKLDYALSREQTNVNGGKMYIQDKVAEYSDEIFERMDNGAHMYFCGLKGMMPGITEMLEGVSAKKGLVWEEKLKEWKKRASGTSRCTRRRPYPRHSALRGQFRRSGGCQTPPI